jgi:uncharacterized phage protein gp47/JayE
MSCREELCVLPSDAGPGCCDPVELPPPAPVAPFNPPGRNVIAYRIGTFSSFRRAMLAELAKSGTPWKESSGLDYQIAIVELWAYLADVLTFYQERIANEAFVGTATQRESLRRLAELLGYRPSPAAGAVGTVAFTIEDAKTVELPPGFRVGSKPVPGKLAAVFETITGLTAYGAHSAIPLATRGPTRQFAPLSIYFDFYAGALFEQLVAAEAIYGSLGSAYLTTFGYEQSAFKAVSDVLKPTVEGSATAASSTSTTSTTSSTPSPLSESGELIEAATTSTGIFGDLTTFVSNAFIYSVSFLPIGNTREVVLKGTSTELTAGDFLLVIVSGGATQANRRVRRINAVSTDAESNTTTIRWTEPKGETYADTDDKVELFALRVTASPFGHDAPAWALLPPEMTNRDPTPTFTGDDNKFPDAPFKENWDDPKNALYFLPSAGGGVLLDAAYDDAHGATDEPTTRWAVFDDGANHQVVKITSAEAETVSAYSFNDKVTRLKLAESLDSKKFKLRTTTIRTGSERLEIEPNLPLGAVVTGSTLILDGLFPKLKADQMVAIKGPEDGGDPEVLLMELASLQGPPNVDEAHGVTTVTLKQPLTRRYVRAGTVLLANLVGVTQGETVRDEILGNGDGSAFQTLKLKEKPLTYLPATDPEGLSSVESSLTVTVNRVSWEERPTLLGGLPNDQAFRTFDDDEETTFVQFGDGVEGARPPTGRDNIRARYRKGAGAHGNVETSGVERLIDNLPGVQKVVNPVPTAGGEDRESVDRIRSNAPASVSTFGRAISASDYAALALRYPSIGKASAVWIVRDPVTHEPVPQPYILLTVATAEGGDLSGETGLLARLRAFLDARRDPNIPLRIQDVTRVPIEVIAEIDVDDRYGRLATLAAAIARLDPVTTPGAEPGFFAFERIGFAESVHLSALYAEIQAAEGVRAVRITGLRRLSPADPAGTIREHIFIRPSEVASVVNDPAHPELGRVVITLGTGGFDDA